jgi:hypothetical protein
MISTLSSETVVSVVFLLATMLYHGSPDGKYMLWNIEIN